MTTLAPNQSVPLCTASGIYDDIELYLGQLVIRPRAFFAQICAYREILDLSDIESVKNYPKRSDHSAWIQMKITCYKHKPVEISYYPSAQPQMRELNKVLHELLSAQTHHD